jgi:hypothetical protein
MINGPAIPTFWFRPSKSIRRCSHARRTWWQPTPLFTQRKMKQLPKQRASSVSAFLIVPPKVPSANVQKKRWFRNGQKWRTGCEGRISVAKRRHGLNRCRYKGENGMKRWVGLGVIADNIINIGRAIEKQSQT